ncbi:MAG TPA: hypothetical protein VF789_18850 [Thermoanaerobaculia bacterium]
MRRFLFFALPLLVLAMALYAFVQEAFGMAPDPALLSPSAPPRLPGWMPLATWVLESIGLAALFLMIQGRGGSRLASGLLAGWIAWVFRGPLLVVTVVSLAGLAPGPWWVLVFSWWVLYTVCGLLLGVVAVSAGLPP